MFKVFNTGLNIKRHPEPQKLINRKNLIDFMDLNSKFI